MTIELGATKAQGEDDSFDDLESKGTPETKAPPEQSPPPTEDRVQQAKDRVQERKAKLAKALADLNTLRDKLEAGLAKVTHRVKDAQANLDCAFRGLGQAIAEDDEPESAEPPPKTTIGTNFEIAPIEMLKLSDRAHKALVDTNEIKTLGQLAEYHEVNGTLAGLDGVTDFMATQILKKYHAFIESQK